ICCGWQGSMLMPSIAAWPLSQRRTDPRSEVAICHSTSRLSLPSGRGSIDSAASVVMRVDGSSSLAAASAENDLSTPGGDHANELLDTRRSFQLGALPRIDLGDLLDRRLRLARERFGNRPILECAVRIAAFIAHDTLVWRNRGRRHCTARSALRWIST